MAALELDNVAVGYRSGSSTTTLLRGINLSVEAGNLVALLGRNGAGKSTLIRALSGADKVLEGEIRVNGNDIGKLRERELARLIAIVTTEAINAGALTVTELVGLGRQPHTGFLGRLTKHDNEIVEKAIQCTGLSHLAKKMVNQLSDGERQKTMIARALAQETPIIILDEPTAFLDVANRIETMHLLHNLAHEHNKAVLLSSHDISQSVLLADSLWVITRDGTVESGATKEIISKGLMNRIFSSANIEFNPQILDFQYIESKSATMPN
ncbi:MAG: ABC transporter ATP-binding protein [Muribaculaceae bacterium]|nr:ABC transporter ATP-binding protein [Muribaculaceae bacterium]